MPLSDEQKAAIQTLKDVSAEDAEEFRTELQGANNTVVHHIFRRGFAEAEGRYKPRAEEAEAKVTAAEAKAQAAEQKLQEAQGKQPDVEKLNADWQAKYERDLAAKDAELESEKAARKQERESRKLADLRAELGAISDPQYAEYLATKHIGRIRDKDDGTVELLEEGSEVLPVQLPKGKTAYQHLAAEILQRVAPDRKTSEVDGGGGVDRGGGGSTGSIYDRIREQAKERQKETADSPERQRWTRSAG